MKPIFLKIDNRVKNLNDSEACLYALIVYGNFTDKNITRKYLSTCSGFSEEYIKDMIEKINMSGLINKDITYSNNTFSGAIKTTVHYTMEYEKFFKVGLNFITDNITSPKLIGFAIRLRSLAFDDTLNIKMNKKEIAKELGITYILLNKRLKDLESIGFKLERLDDCYKIIYDDKYFPTNNKCYLDESHIRTINTVLETPNNSRLYKQTVYFIKNKMHYQFNANKLYDDVLSGLFGTDYNLENKRIEKITFDF